MHKETNSWGWRRCEGPSRREGESDEEDEAVLSRERGAGGGGGYVWDTRVCIDFLCVQEARQTISKNVTTPVTNRLRKCIQLHFLEQEKRKIERHTIQMYYQSWVYRMNIIWERWTILSELWTLVYSIHVQYPCTSHRIYQMLIKKLIASKLYVAYCANPENVKTLLCWIWIMGQTFLGGYGIVILDSDEL